MNGILKKKNKKNICHIENALLLNIFLFFLKNTLSMFHP